MVPKYVDSIPTCVPITELLSLLINRGFVVLSQSVRDPHFNELNFAVKSNLITEVGEIVVENITQHSPTVFICECHWSKVEIVNLL